MFTKIKQSLKTLFSKTKTVAGKAAETGRDVAKKTAKKAGEVGAVVVEKSGAYKELGKKAGETAEIAKEKPLNLKKKESKPKN